MSARETSMKKISMILAGLLLAGLVGCAATKGAAIGASVGTVVNIID